MKMTDIVNIVKKILANGGSIDTHDPAMMASIYAGQCQTLNDRLRACHDALQNGKSAQAFSLAEEAPPLIPLCEAMVGIESSGWADLCRGKGWAVPDPLDREALERLKRALTLEKSLTPLLTRLRQANNMGDGARCIAVLREIVAMDPDDPGWRHQLAAFETYRMQQIPGELARLKAANDLDAVALRIVELKQKWEIPVDSGLLSDAEIFLETALSNKARDEATALFHRIDAAHRAEDAEALGLAVKALQELEKSRYFKRDGEMLRQYERYKSAMAWYREKVRLFNDQNARAEILSQIEEKIAHGTDQGLRELLEALVRFDAPVPDGLEERIESILDNARQMRQKSRMKRRRRYLMVAGLMGCLMLLVLGFLFFRWEKSDLASRFDQAIAAEDLPQARSILTSMAGEQAHLFNAQEIEQAGNRTDALERLLEEKSLEFQTLLSRLEKMAGHQFTGVSVVSVEALIGDAEKKKDFGDPLEVGRLGKVVQLWNQKKLMIKAEDEEALSRILDRLEKGFGPLLPLGGGQNRAPIDSINSDNESRSGEPNESRSGDQLDKKRLEKQLELIKTLLNEGKALHLSLMDTTMRDRLTQFEKRWMELNQGLERRDRAIRSLQEAGTLQAYLSALRQLMEDFPEEPISQSVSPVVAMESTYTDLVAPPGRSIMAGNSFRRMEAEWLARLNHNVSLHLDEVKERYRQMERTPRFTDLWRCTVQKPNLSPQTWYFSGKPLQKYIDGVGSYSGIAFAAGPTDTEPDFASAHVITAHVRDLMKMPHCDVVQKMLDHLLFEPGIQSILDAMGEIYRESDETVSPVLKLHLIHFLFQALETLAGQETVHEFQPMMRAFEDFFERSEVNWLCTSHRKYSLERRKAREILNEHMGRSDPLGRFKMKRDLKEFAVKRVIQWVGWVDPEGNHELRFSSGRPPGEVWVVRQQDGSGRPAIYVAGERKGDEILLGDGHGDFIPGEPLFAPYDADITRALLQRLAKDLKGRLPPGDDGDFWPLIWPVNVRLMEG